MHVMRWDLGWDGVRGGDLTLVSCGVIILLFGAGPNAVACDLEGYVYVTEDENHAIRIISPNG
jgi:hypothetical protein